MDQARRRFLTKQQLLASSDIADPSQSAASLARERTVSVPPKIAKISALLADAQQTFERVPLSTLQRARRHSAHYERKVDLCGRQRPRAGQTIPRAGRRRAPHQGTSPRTRGSRRSPPPDDDPGDGEGPAEPTCWNCGKSVAHRRKGAKWCGGTPEEDKRGERCRKEFEAKEKAIRERRFDPPPDWLDAKRQTARHEHYLSDVELSPSVAVSGKAVDPYKDDPRLDPWHRHRLRKRGPDKGVTTNPFWERLMTTDSTGQPLGSAPRGATPDPAAKRERGAGKPRLGLRARSGLPPHNYGDPRRGMLQPSWERTEVPTLPPMVMLIRHHHTAALGRSEQRHLAVAA